MNVAHNLDPKLIQMCIQRQPAVVVGSETPDDGPAFISHEIGPISAFQGSK